MKTSELKRVRLVALVLALVSGGPLRAVPRAADLADGLAAPDWTAVGGQVDAWFGLSVAGAGDVNGDGYGDVIAGAPGYDGGQADEGAAFLYLGSPAGPGPQASWSAAGGVAEAYLGQSVAGAGDVNGDGYDDVLAGAPWYTGPESAGGLAFAYYGSATGPGAMPDWTAEGVASWALLGNAVAGAGDVNGDGYDDVIVGAPSYRTAFPVGALFVYYGSAAGLRAAPDWEYVGTEAQGVMGASVAGAGDVNGDGYDDVIAGSGLNDVGAAHLFYGSAAGLAAAPGWSVTGDQLDSYLGYAVGAAGDVDGDGYDDVLVGARYYDAGQADEGRVMLYRGSAGGLQAVPAWTQDGDADWADWGNTVGSPGDVNGDGYDDVLVGGHGYGDGQVDQWRATLYYGSPDLSLAAAWTAGADGHSPVLGIAAGGSGDVNGDGRPDVIVGNPVHDGSRPDEGAAFVYDTPAAQPIAGLLAWNDGPTPLGSTTVLTATVEAGAPVTYTWALGDGSRSSGERVEHVYPGPGLYTAVVTAANSLGSAVAATVVRVDDQGTAPLFTVFLPLVWR